MKNLKIGSKFIGMDQKPFIIAEMSGNHNQSLERALEITEEAAKSGVDALKLQTYTPDTMTLNISKGDFFIKDKKNPWFGKSLYDLYKIAYTPWDWHSEIMAKANSLGMLCFSTPFDLTAVDFLEDLDVPAYKIASFENNDMRLIKRVAKTGKPIIISTGMASLAEIDQIILLLKEAGCENFVLLKCTSSYPSTPINSNVITIPHFRELFNCEVGLSDHTLGIGAAIAAIAHGATVIEKHFTLNRSDGGVDSDFSMEPNEMRVLVEESERAWQSLGKVSYGRQKSEESSLIFRRSCYISKNMKKGDVFNEENLRIVRPGSGLPPKYFKIFKGKKVNRDVEMGTRLSWDLIGE